MAYANFLSENLRPCLLEPSASARRLCSKLAGVIAHLNAHVHDVRRGIEEGVAILGDVMEESVACKAATPALAVADPDSPDDDDDDASASSNSRAAAGGAATTSATAAAAAATTRVAMRRANGTRAWAASLGGEGGGDGNTSADGTVGGLYGIVEDILSFSNAVVFGAGGGTSNKSEGDPLTLITIDDLLHYWHRLLCTCPCKLPSANHPECTFRKTYTAYGTHSSGAFVIAEEEDGGFDDDGGDDSDALSASLPSSLGRVASVESTAGGDRSPAAQQPSQHLNRCRTRSEEEDRAVLPAPLGELVRSRAGSSAAAAAAVLNRAESFKQVAANDLVTQTASSAASAGAAIDVIFLDVDGVLAPCRCVTLEAEPETEAHYMSDGMCALSIRCLRNLNRVVRRSGAKIVVTSTWRQYPEMLAHLCDCLEKEGGPALRNAVVGATPILLAKSAATGPTSRGLEIEQWLASAARDGTRVGKMVVFEDSPAHLRTIQECVPQAKLCVTKMTCADQDKEGLSDEHAARAIEYFIGTSDGGGGAT